MRRALWLPVVALLAAWALPGLAAAQLPPVPGPRALTITRGSGAERVVHLSFDAGADTGYAALILDTLAAEGIPASFGLTGRWAEANPELTRRIVAEGHELINHTWDHRSFTGRSDRQGGQTSAQIQEQLRRTEAVLVELTGQSPQPYFRPPYGDYDDRVLEAAYAAGYQFNVLWTIDSGGWRRIPAAQIVARCVQQVEPGAIIIMHVGAQSQDGPALPALIAALRERGYGFVGLTVLLGG